MRCRMHFSRVQPTGYRHSYKLPQLRPVVLPTCPSPSFRPGASGPAPSSPGPAQQPRPVLQAQRQSGCPEAAKCTTAACGFMSCIIRHQESAARVESGPAEDDSKATVRELLREVKAEARDAAAERKKGGDAWAKAPDNKALETIYKDLEKRVASLDEQCRALEAHLTGSTTCLPGRDNHAAHGPRDLSKVVASLRKVLEDELGRPRADEFDDDDLELLAAEKFKDAEDLRDAASQGLLATLGLPGARLSDLHQHFTFQGVLDKTYTTFLGSLLTATESDGILALGKGACFPWLESMVLDPYSPAQGPSSAAQGPSSPAQGPSSAAQAPSPRDALVVRACYPQLARKISSTRLRAQLLTGTPGTGKTMFIWYFIRYLHQLDPVPVIVYEFDTHDSRHTHDSFLIKGRQVFRGTRADFEDEIRDPATWYITDGVQPVSTAAHTLMVSFPSRDQYKLFYNRGASLLYMPVWSKEEQLFAFHQLYSAHFPQLTQQRVERLIGVYGSGSIRHVLTIPSQRAVKHDEEYIMTFNQMVLEVDTRKILTGFAIDKLPESSQRLIHLFPSADFETAQCQFCSDYGIDKFKEKCQREGVAPMLMHGGFYLSLQKPNPGASSSSSDAPAAGSVAGTLPATSAT